MLLVFVYDPVILNQILARLLTLCGDYLQRYSLRTNVPLVKYINCYVTNEELDHLVNSPKEYYRNYVKKV